MRLERYGWSRAVQIEESELQTASLLELVGCNYTHFDFPVSVKHIGINVILVIWFVDCAWVH